MANRRQHQSRGATMVEFAIISVALFTLIFGIIEGGFAVRARSSVNNAIDDAARQGAVAGAQADADFRIINQLVRRDVNAADVQYVVVYKAASGSAPVPASCLVGPLGTEVDGLCSVYRPNETTGNFSTDPGQYGCPGGVGERWCPQSRATVTDEINFLGVYVRANYEPILNQIFFDFDFRVDANALQAIETSGERELGSDDGDGV